MSEGNMFDLSGKVALVTGGGSGMGRSMCEGFAEAGADVAVADLNEDSAKETAGILSKYGRKAFAIKADVSNAADVDNMVQQVVAKLGKLDIACNNAGALVGKYLIHETPEAIWDTIMAVNFKGVFLCTKAEVSVMLKQGKGGSIINTSSVGALIPGDVEMMGSIYNSAKAGVICFSRMAAGEYGKDGIRVNAIAPGMIMGTAFAAERRKNAPPPPPEKVAAMLSRIALRRPGKADDVKGIVVYLASDAASYTTGQLFVVDGGLT
jgi:NAD(P)-dependent dehydrogenase (short-subunit alcohol dehydrogenase family)